MRADKRFVNQPATFWANVRSISQVIGYTERVKGKKKENEKRSGAVKIHRLPDMVAAMRKLGLGSDHLVIDGKPTPLGKALEDYFKYRANVLTKFVEPNLMELDDARELFLQTKKKLKPKCPIPLNKQKGKKKGPAYLTGLVNMLIECSAGNLPVDYDPRALTTITADNAPLRTLSRRVDGAFPGAVNPIAIWEVKEYYHTTTFGSRIADGVFETQLDGIELQELERAEGFPIEHLLVVDAYFTWWNCGRSYLCRIIDLLHMGLVDEVLFGREVAVALPRIVKRWRYAYNLREGNKPSLPARPKAARKRRP